MSGKIMIVGTGNVGASIAFALINQRTAVKELVLVDINTDDAEGEVMDLNDALTVAPSWMKIHAGDYNEAKDCDICILTAGANQHPGESRTDLLQKNAQITREIVEQVMQARFDGIFLVVTNPMDTLTYLVYKTSGLPPERVIGSGTVLDSARLRFGIAGEVGVHPKSVHAYQIGEHGDSEFALWSTANIGGENAGHFLSPKTRQKLEQDVRDEAYRIICKKGATHYGIGACVVQVLNSILNDERRILPVSTYDDFNDVYYGFPSIIAREGAVRRLDISMTEKEGISLQKSINILRKSIHDMENPE